MAKEIERKFLVNGPAYREGAEAVHYHQGYIPTLNGTTVRVRIAGEKAMITLKGRAVGFSRDEYEYAIPVADAEEMLARLCVPPTIEKVRYTLPWGHGRHWEVDEFMGDNAGLTVAEIEVGSEDEAFERPAWLGREVTGDPKYYNSALCRRPYSQWSEEEK
jgi:adenylate cyclase